MRRSSLPEFVARWVLTGVMGLLAFSRSADAEPPEGVRALASELVVRVRASDRESNQEIQTGCGVVIGYDDLAVTILTARHVIEDALTGQSKTRVTVLFPGTSNWRDCEIGPTLSDSPKPDAAFLKVKRSDTPFAGSPRCSEIVLSPPPQTGAGVHVYGLDPSKNEMVWRPGVLNGVADGVVSFDGMEVVGGYSGGLLVSDVGIVGMTILAGPNGKNHEALQLSPLLSLVTSKGGSVAVQENKAIGGVERLFAEQLVAAMDVWDLQERGQHGQAFWVALAPRARAANSFTFDAITPKSRTEVRITGNGAALAMEFPSDLSGLPRSAAKLPRGTYRLEIDPTVAISGFLILKGTFEAAVVYLALPTAHAEMLAARAMFEASTGAGPPKLDDEMLKALQSRELPHLDRAPMPFSVVISPRSSIEFRTPVATHRHNPVGVAGQFFRPDDTPLQRDEKRQVAIQTTWTNLRFQVTPQQAGEKEIAGEPLPWPRGELHLQLEPTEKVLRVGCSDADRTQRQTLGSTYMLVQGLRLEYR